MRAQSYDEGANTIDIVWTTGADVLRCDWMDGSYIERLATGPENVRLDRLNAGAAFLDTHDAYQLSSVIGSVVPGSARMEGGTGVATVKLSRAAGAADIVQNIRDGVINNISAGYIVHAYTRTEASDGVPAVMLATDWEPVELSAVPVPADPGAQIRLAQRSASGLVVHPCTITRAEGSNTEANMADDLKPGDAGLKNADATKSKKPDPTPPAEPNNPKDNPDMIVDKPNGDAPPVPGQPGLRDPGDASPLPLTDEQIERAMQRAAERAIEGERMRANDITALGARFGLRDFAAEHVRTGTKVENFRRLVMDKLADERAADGGPSNTAARSEPSLEAATRNDRTAGAAWARRVLNCPAQGDAR